MSGTPTSPPGKLIRPPVSLADKVDRGPGGMTEEEMLGRAEAAVESLKDEYLDWVTIEIDNLEKAWRKAESDPENRETHLKKLAGLAHDVKGEGTTYDYPLMTQLGDSLWRIVTTISDGSDSRSAAQLDIVGQHIGAMRVVIRDRMKDGGGDLGNALLATLNDAVDRFGD